MTRSIPSQNHCGILTGKINNITVIDIDCDSPYITLLDNTTLNVETPSGGAHYYFEYEDSLQSIYHTLDKLSIYNNQSCVFFGDGYRVLNEVPIVKMSEVFLMALQNAQASREEEVVDQKLYELLNILPDEWFNDHEHILQLIHVLRNQIFNHNSRRISTMRRLMVERSDCYHERLLRHYFNLRMTYKQQRFGLCALSKVIKEYYPLQYATWLQKWKPIKDTVRTNLIYKHGSQVKLSDIRAIHSVDAAKLLQMNNQFTTIKQNICKSCLNKHRVGCCQNYKREARTSCIFVNNVELV